MQEQKDLDKIIIDKTINSLKKNHFEVILCSDKKEIIKKLSKIIGKNDIIGYGGSRTLEEIGFFDIFTKTNYPNLLDRKKPDITPEEKKDVQAKALTSDVFLSSANAISQSGELVLIDKWGNRCAPMTYGPKKRIFIAGKNKITKDLSSAIDRAKNTASVLNNIRFETNNPCTKKGECLDCNSENRLCGVTTILHRSFPERSVLVIIVDENLGF